MTVDCHWVEGNLEALFCDNLSDEESRLVLAHVENCASCQGEVQSLRAIDPLVKGHFQRELQLAGRPRVVHSGRLLGLSASAVTAVVVLMLLFRTPQPGPVVRPAGGPEPTSAVSSTLPPPPIKTQETGEVERAKPTLESGLPVDRQRETPPPVTAGSPDFLVLDPAGYSHSLAEYRGRVVVVAVWNSAQPESIANFERLYKANATNAKFRFLGVSNERDRKPANTTFPVFYNQGSKLLGANPGDFVLLDENGAAELRGSLVRDFEGLRRALQEK